MKDFHEFVSRLLTFWLGCYAFILLPGLLNGLFMFVLADFTLPAKHYFDIINTVYVGSLWLIPTVFLAISCYLSRPGQSPPKNDRRINTRPHDSKFFTGY
jgi:hypothetical protein